MSGKPAYNARENIMTTVTLRAMRWLIKTDNQDLKRHRALHVLVVF